MDEYVMCGGEPFRVRQDGSRVRVPKVPEDWGTATLPPKQPRKTRSAPVRRGYSAAAPDPVMQRFNSMRMRASERVLPFDLTYEWVAERLHFTHCEATGIEFKAGKKGPWTRSFDRTDNKLGYTMDNVKMVCLCYNTAKNMWDASVLQKLAHALLRKSKSTTRRMRFA